MSVRTALLRIYRPIIIPFAVVLTACELIAVIAVASHRDLGFSMWLMLTGSAEKYWLFVVGMILVTMNLRQFVSNGVTRHEFLAGAGGYGLILGAGWTVAIMLGHVVEGGLLSAAGRRGDDYPGIGLSGLLSDFAHALPLALGWMVAGALIAAGFYRWRFGWAAWAGLIVGLVPAGVADMLLSYDEFGVAVDKLPYPAALAISSAVTAAGWVMLRRVVGDVPIRRTAG